MSLVGRSFLVSMLLELAIAGEHAVLFGPVGAGKTALLRAVERACVEREVSVGFAEEVDGLSDVTTALGRAHPDVDLLAASARIARSRLRNAAHVRRSVLLLDHVAGSGTALKGLLRSLRGTGTGVLLAVDVNEERDRVRMRAWRLARREIAVPLLHGNSIRSVVQGALASVRTPYRVADEDVRALVRASEGLPGRALSLVARLSEARSWSEGRVRVGALRAAAVVDELERYRSKLATLDGAGA